MYSFKQALSQPSNQPRETSQRPLLVVPGKQEPEGSRDNGRPQGKGSPSVPLELVGALTLGNIEQGDKVVRIHSRLFREDVLLVPDRYKPKPEDPVCYTAQEARLLLMAKTDEDLRTIHETKKLSRGHVIYAARAVS